MNMPKRQPGHSKQDYGTPDAFLDAVCERLAIERFEYDLACRRDNRVPHAKRGLYDPEVDAFTVRWGFHGWSWLNPPFAHIGPWAEKCLESWLVYGTQTALLVPASVSSKWWNAFVHDQARVLFVRPRLIFKGTPPNPNTGRLDPYPKDLALVLYGQTPGYDTWRWA